MLRDFFFSQLTICIYRGTVLGMLFYLILIILFGKYSHFIEKAETQMLNNFYRTTKEGAEFEPGTPIVKLLVQRMLVPEGRGSSSVQVWKYLLSLRHSSSPPKR